MNPYQSTLKYAESSKEFLVKISKQYLFFFRLIFNILEILIGSHMATEDNKGLKQLNSNMKKNETFLKY